MNGKKEFSLRIPDELHAFLRKKAFESDMSLNAIIIDKLNKFKEKSENRLK